MISNDAKTSDEVMLDNSNSWDGFYRPVLDPNEQAILPGAKQDHLGIHLIQRAAKTVQTDFRLGYCVWSGAPSAKGKFTDATLKG